MAGTDSWQRDGSTAKVLSLLYWLGKQPWAGDAFRYAAEALDALERGRGQIPRTASDRSCLPTDVAELLGEWREAREVSVFNIGIPTTILAQSEAKQERALLAVLSATTLPTVAEVQAAAVASCAEPVLVAAVRVLLEHEATHKPDEEWHMCEACESLSRRVVSAAEKCPPQSVAEVQAKERERVLSALGGVVARTPEEIATVCRVAEYIGMLGPVPESDDDH